MGNSQTETRARRTILLVEDEALISIREAMTLKRHGYHVLTCATGEQAIEMTMSDSSIELVLMDINLGPGIDGTQAAEAILAARDVPIVFLSSHTEPEVVEKTERITSYGYIVKHSGDPVLLTSVKMAFRLYDSRKLADDTFKHSINGLCVHRMLYNSDGEPVDCEYLKVNEAFGRHTGLSPQSVLGRTITDLYPDEQARDVVNLYARVLSSGASARAEIYFEPTDRWFELCVFPTRETEFTVVLQNITERKRSEQSLAAEKEWLNVTLKSVGDAVVATDMEGRVVLMNPVAEQLTGWTANDALGRPLVEIMNIANAATRVPCENPVERLIREGKTVALANGTLLISADGTEYQIADSAAPIRDTDNSIIGAVLVFRDVTEEYRVAQALRDRERDMARAQSLAQLGSWRIDLETKRVEASDQARKMYGVGDEELTLSDVQSVPLPEYRPMLDDAMKALIEDRAPYDVEFKVRRVSDGTLRYVHSVAEYDEDQHCITGMIQDVTEHKSLVEAKDRAVTESHHRVINNMGMVYSLLGLQADGLSDPSARRLILGAANRVESMMTLYDRLYRSPDLGPVSLQEFLPSLAHDIAGVLKLDDSLSVEVRAEDVELDARLLQTLGVVMNELMTNSVKHAFPHVKSGQISITAQKEDSTVRIVYQDNGPGPPSADHIASSPGFGHELIEAMINQLGGTVHAEAASGMRVTLTVPVGR